MDQLLVLLALALGCVVIGASVATVIVDLLVYIGEAFLTAIATIGRWARRLRR